jgi:site-specific DNA recombinase
MTTKGNSLDAQREACGSYIASQKAQGWIALSDRYDDGGFSGGTLERPALQRLLKDIDAGHVDVVVVYKIDRLSRSLMDFAKLVEAFDRRSVTFVSVTQSFNTTTSMGRLTLNVLLSFAQFEREVTGERIRDKIAASKRKGMGMGGNPPIGYDVAQRKLVVNPAEAETVNLIFRRYLELGCVRLLSTDLESRQILSKRRILASGKIVGGGIMGRSALYAVLNNRAYVGEVINKGKSHPGEHKAIVPRKLFDAVQARLAEPAPRVTSKLRAEQDAPLAGLLFDETGTAMLPTYSIKRGGIRYRYYASRPTLKGERSQAAIHRIPAPPFETFLAGVFGRIGLPDKEPLEFRHAVERITVKAHSLDIELRREATLDHWRSLATDGQQRDRALLDRARDRLREGEVINDAGDRLALILHVRAKFRGGQASVIDLQGKTRPAPHVDLALIKALARAYRFRQLLEDGAVTSIEELARRFGLDRGHAGLTLNLAFLSPAITRAIVSAEQPPGLLLTHLLHAEFRLHGAFRMMRLGASRRDHSANRRVGPPDF